MDEEETISSTTFTREDVIVQIMEDVFGRLLLLGCGRSKKKQTPIDGTTFALADPSNASRQFKLFLEVVSDLMELCHQSFVVDKYDDPTTSVNKLLVLLKAMAIEVDFPAAKFKQGYGEAVCVTLKNLCNKALEMTKFTFTKPAYLQEDFADEAEPDDDEVDMEEELPQITEELLYSDLNREIKDADVGEGLDDSSHHLIMATVDPLAWKTELERVGPKLKAKGIEHGTKEWRTHIESTKKQHAIVTTDSPATCLQLRQIKNELEGTLEHVTSKEKHVNGHFYDLSASFQQVKETFDSVQTSFKVKSAQLDDMSIEYGILSTTLSDIKSTMDNRGSSMTDTSPLVNIKNALATLKSDISTYDLRIGMVGHSLLQANARSERQDNSSNFKRYDSDDDMY